MVVYQPSDYNLFSQHDISVSVLEPGNALNLQIAKSTDMIRNFTLDFWIDEGWYVGKLREVPGVFSQGESLEELKENIQDAYSLMMEETMQLPVEKFNSTELEMNVP